MAWRLLKHLKISYKKIRINISRKSCIISKSTHTVCNITAIASTYSHLSCT